MLWYLLYPLRGTTQPPILSASHPIRRAFYRHGKAIGQHWLLAMLVTVAIAMGFSYPTIFLAESPTAGFAAYPHHVWTTVKPFFGHPDVTDVEMRQVWIHGSYMKALEKDVLKSALDIQHTIVGDQTVTTIYPALGDSLRFSNLSWGYHSPLIYWNNSHEALDSDMDLVKTINDHSGTSSSLNIALRPASVFAGKQFDRRKLRAADALVITLMNKVDGGAQAGDRLTESMRILADGACDNCMLFPHDGLITRNRTYEFSFTPLSAQEHVALTFAYSCMALYVLLSLRRLKAFHSRFGLVVTAITQMTCSILASFTICGILKINLSMIPQNAYPFVVLVIGLENMFRLINAILAHPATMATDLRIANALGDVGPVSTAAAVQNVFLLSVLAQFVSPGVAAFCAFACIATLFDTFFLLTFFIAVLNVDIRRLELQDALARSSHSNQLRPKRKPSPYHQATWFNAMVRGRLPFSTRMAGTAVTTTFILILDYHFFERHEKVSNLRHLLGLARRVAPSAEDFETFAPPPINATLTPSEWMRMQDFDTAREVMRLAKPGADHFIIRVFAPLIVVLAGADRTEAPVGAEAWPYALRNFAIYHFYPVAVAIIFAVAFVAVLMNFLLYSDAEEQTKSDDHINEALTVTTLFPGHRLDIVKLSANAAGHIISIGLDRSMTLCVLDRSACQHRHIALSPGVLGSMQWPIRRAVVDESGEWIAFHAADDQIILHNRKTGAVVYQALMLPDDHPSVIFRFLQLTCTDALRTCLLIVTSGGRVAIRCVDSDWEHTDVLSSVPLLGGAIIDTSISKQTLSVATEDARLIAFAFRGDTWCEAISGTLPLASTHGRLTGYIYIHQYPELGNDLLVVTSTTAALFLNSQSLEPVANIAIEAADDSPKKLILGSVTQCTACGGLALRSVGAVAISSTGGEVTMKAWLADENHLRPICLRRTTTMCCFLEGTTRHDTRLTNAGAWHPVGTESVLGLRKRDTRSSSDSPGSTTTRHRRRPRQKSTPSEQAHTWEAYKLSLNGELEVVEASNTLEDDTKQSPALFVNTAGPVVSLDSRSIAVALGNTIKVIRAGRSGAPLQQSHAHVLERHSSASRKSMVPMRKTQ